MASLKNHPDDIVRLGRELQARGYAVGEHPLFGGVHPTAHDPKGRHHTKPARAIDVNRDRGGAYGPNEHTYLDRLAPEVDARGFGVAWNVAPGNHETHAHIETRGANDGGRTGYRLRGSRQNYRLQVDGRWGPATWAGVAWALHMPAPRVATWNGAGDVTTALQLLLRTEMRNNDVTPDGLLGPKTWQALGDVMGVATPKQPTTSFASLTVLVQMTIVAFGRLV